MKFIRTVLLVSLIIIVPWFFYANQTQQKATCVLYELTGARQGVVQHLTCALNGTAR